MPARLSETLCSKTLDSIEGKLHKAIGAFNAPRMQGRFKGFENIFKIIGRRRLQGKT